MVHDAHSKKPVVWLRVYSGEVAQGETLRNSRTGASERPTRLLTMHGEETRDLPSAGPGAICAAVGMKSTRTGDTLILQPRDEAADLVLPCAPPPLYGN